MTTRIPEAPSSIIFGSERILDVIALSIKNSETRLDICVDAWTVIFAIRHSRIYDTLLEASSTRKLKIRLVTEITQENSEICKDLLKAGVEVKHLDRIRASFGTNGLECFSFFSFQEGTSPGELTYTNSQSVIDHYDSVFESLFKNGIRIEERLSYLSTRAGKSPEAASHTKVIRGIEQVSMFIVSFLDRIKAIDYDLPFVYAIADRNSPILLSNLEWMIEETVRAHPNFEGKLITDLQKDNINYIEKLLELGIKVRHIEGIKARFAFSKDEHIETSGNIVGGLPDEMVWSDSLSLIAQSKQIFDTLWETGLPAESRIMQIQEGKEQSVSKIIRGTQDIAEEIEELISGATQSISIVFSQRELSRTTSRILNSLAQVLSSKEVRTRILSTESLPHDSQIFPQADVDWQQIDEPFLDLVIVDDLRGIIVSRSSPNEATNGFELGVMSTDQATVRSFVSIFNALFRESGLRQKEGKARQDALKAMENEARTRRQIELLQDILTHDMRNHNQVALLSAELLLEQLAWGGGIKNDDSLRGLAQGVISSIECSNDLIERAKGFGKMISHPITQQGSVSFMGSLNRTVELLKKANPQKHIALSIEIVPASLAIKSVMVEADEFFDEVVLNILSNSIKYTASPEVPIEILVEDSSDKWKISISDRGIGVPDNFRSAKSFNRYLKGAKGSGLGLSIIHTLVMERYRGELTIEPRTDGLKGTVVQLLMNKGSAPERMRKSGKATPRYEDRLPNSWNRKELFDGTVSPASES